MPFQLSNCIEKFAKSGRVVIISKSVVRINDTYRSKRIIPFGQTKLTEYGEDNNGQNGSELPHVT